MVNNKLKQFISITLKGNLNNTFNLQGKKIVSLIMGMLKEERETAHTRVLELINKEFQNAEHKSFLAKWQGLELEAEVYERLKEDILFDIKEKLKKLN